MNNFVKRVVCQASFMIVAAAAILSSAVLAAPSLDPWHDKTATGNQLARAFYDLLALTGSPTGVLGTTERENIRSRELVKPYLDPAFQFQSATGTRFTIENYLPTDIDEFTIQGVRETRPTENFVVLRYLVRTENAVSPATGAVMSDSWAPRLTVFQWNEKKSQWQLVSHASFNTPIAAICNSNSALMLPLKGNASKEDFDLGASLARNFYSLIESGDGKPMMSPAIQGQAASGSGYTTPTEYIPGKISKVTLSDTVVSRNRNVLVVSLGAQADETLHSGKEKLGATKKPRLLVFLKHPINQWQLIALATFNPPSVLPAGASCVAASRR